MGPLLALIATDIVALQRTARDIFVDRSVTEYAVNLVLATRAPEKFNMPELKTFIEFGASPRASLALVRAGRALALLRGRTYVVPQDVFDIAPEVLRHRLVLSYEALATGTGAEAVLNRILSTVPAPRVTPVQGNESISNSASYQQPQPTSPDVANNGAYAGAAAQSPTGTTNWGQPN